MSAEVKHTEGKWSVRPHWSDEDSFEVFPEYDGPPEFGEWSPIAEVRSGKDDDAEANAHLMAAAPDLLEALEPFAKLFERALTEPGFAEDDDTVFFGNKAGRRVTYGDFRRARAAISRATGAS